MTEIKPSAAVGKGYGFDLWTDRRPHLFLAGSIEQDTAEKWQDRVVQMLKDDDCVILNPRRDDWNKSTWQSKSNPYFYKQVDWELYALDECAIKGWVFMYFDPKTKSPITLMELGMLSQKVLRNFIVVCPDGFWRRGNVEIVCEKRIIPLYNTLEEGVGKLKELMFAKKQQ